MIMDEPRPTQAEYCRGTCGDLLRLSSILPELDDGLKSEYKDRYCQDCYNQLNNVSRET